MQAEKWFINGAPTYADRVWDGRPVEGLLFGTTGGPLRTAELAAALPAWRAHGLTFVAVHWQSNAVHRQSELAELEVVLEEADWHRMAVMLTLFDRVRAPQLQGEGAVLREASEVLEWLTAKGFRNVLVEVCRAGEHPDVRQPVLRPDPGDELLRLVRGAGIPAGACYSPGRLPPPAVVAASDFLLLNGADLGPAALARLVEEARWVEGYRPMPVLLVGTGASRSLEAAVAAYAGWCQTASGPPAPGARVGGPFPSGVRRVTGV
jgi:hypothetical protein